MGAAFNDTCCTFEVMSLTNNLIIPLVFDTEFLLCIPWNTIVF